MATVYLVPVGSLFQALSDSGAVGSGYKLYTYVGGSVSTAQTTYTDSTGTTANSNPIILGSNGRFQSVNVWVTAGVTLKLVLTDSSGSAITGGTIDNVPAINSGDSSGIAFLQSGTSAQSRTVQSKLRDTVSVKDFGAVGDGTTNDATAIQAAIVAADQVYFPPGNYRIDSSITVNSSNKRLVGAGVGVSVIQNYGLGYALNIASSGGVSSTIVGGSVSDLEINGRSVGGCLRMYDVAQWRVERVKCSGSTSEGVLCEMVVDSSLINCVSISNATDGFALNDSTKSSVEFNTNAVQMYGCVAYSNVTGLRIRRSRGNVILGGEISSNDVNFELLGGERNTISGVWVENATTRALRITSSTSGLGVTYSGDYNKIVNNMISTGTGTVEVASGTTNFFEANYIGVNITIGSSATLTYLGRHAGFLGALTDNGSGTINQQNPSSQYIKTSSALRYQMTVGSTVDFISDIQAFRFAQVRGLSTSATQANNLFGYVDITGTATSANVTFGTAETDAAYGVVFGAWWVSGTPASGSEACYMTARATSGFTINVRTAPGAGNTVRVHWLLIR